MATTVPVEQHVGGAAGGRDAARSRRRRLAGPLLPVRLRPLNRPLLWLEVAIIAVSYYCYRLTQNAATSGRVAPFHRGFDVLRVERWSHIDVEHWLNHAVDDHFGWLMVGMNYYYATLHFIMPIAVLAWVYRRHPERYRAVRTVVVVTTLVALVGFYFYALCPPRLLIPAGHPGSFIDTFCEHHTWGKTTCDGVGGLDGKLTNQYAAMPSLHIGWASWCAVVIAQLAERRWVKVLGVLYPFATLTVILCTGNHYVLDAVGGLAVLAVGFLVQRLLHGRPVFGPLAPADGTEPARIPAPGAEPAVDVTAAG